MSIEIGQRQLRQDRTNVDADDSNSFFVQVKESWSAAARYVAVSAFRDPSLFDELFCNYGDCAALQARVPSQIRTRNWFMTANEIEHDAPVNMASRSAGRDTKIGEIDLSH